jgi:hypothetical protein
VEAFDQVLTWLDGGAPWAAAGTALVALSFVLFNSLRIVLYLPQLLTCWRDELGCPTINLWTWNCWTAANASTGLYFWIFQGDAWALVLNLANAAMCLATVVVTLTRRRAYAARRRPQTAPKCRAAMRQWT